MKRGPPAPVSDARDRNIFLLASAVAIVGVLGFIGWTALRLGGDTVAIAVDDIGEAVAAFVAAACCVIAAKRTTGRPRLGWSLLAASAGFWAAGEVVWTVYEVVLGVAVPSPSAADLGFLAAIPLAATAIVMFFSTPRGTSTRLRLWLDGAIVFFALFYVSWAFGLSAIYHQQGDGVAQKAIQLAYPVGDILVGTVLILAIRRAPASAVGTLVLLLGGLAAISMSDSAFAYLSSNSNFGAIGSVFDVGWVAGYLMIGLAALWPAHAARAEQLERPINSWQLVLPWLPVLAAGITAISLALTGQDSRPILTSLGGALVVLVMLSQIYSHGESLSLLVRIRRNAAILNDILLHAPLGVIRVGPDRKIIQANPMAEVLLRRQESQLVGAPLATFMPPGNAVGAGIGLRALEDGSTGAAESETEAVRGDGTVMWLHWSATAVRKVDGVLDYFILMFNDTTARHEAEAAIVSNLNVLERLNRLKSEFLTMVKHEFRTALVGIQGFSELMRDDQELDVAAVQELAREIYNDASRLDQMLDKMLDLDRIEANKVQIHVAAVDLGATVREAAARARGSGDGDRFTIDLDPDLPPVSGDAGRLGQVLDILLSNAIRYSPEASEITVSAHRQPGQVILSVRDRGVGMPPDFDESLFARYRWSANNPTTKVIGTGLGLPIARQIVEMHSGRIWFESKLGVGSEFHFSLPLSSDRAGTPELPAKARSLTLAS